MIARATSESVSESPSRRSQHEIDALAAFYTPPTVADAVVRAAGLSGDELVLEPSVGEGALVAAVLRRFPIGVKFKAYDINPKAVESLDGISGDIETTVGDFLEALPDANKLCDVVLANPPFTRNHDIPARRRKSLRQRFKIKGAAGLWVYFLHHAISFLKPGGKLVSIVPGSASFSKYGLQLVDELGLLFESVSVIQFRERIEWDGGASEHGALLVATGLRQAPKAFESKRGISSAVALQAPRQLGTFAEVSIGIVTGRNSLFLLDQKRKKESGIRDSQFVPVVSRASQVRGAKITKRDLVALASRGERTMLLAPKRCSKRVSAYLASVTPADVNATSWFRRREPWWKVDTRGRCDAVITYMNHGGPRLAFVEAGIQCTNTLHRLSFHREVTSDQKWACLMSVVSTMGQLAAEQIGRPYGGGILKLEPSEVRLLPVVERNQPFSEAEKRMFSRQLSSDPEAARRLADELLLAPALGADAQVKIRVMEYELAALRALRLKRKAEGRK